MTEQSISESAISESAISESAISEPSEQGFDMSIVNLLKQAVFWNIQLG